MKKKFIVFFMAITFTVGMACTAEANLILTDWEFYEDGFLVTSSIDGSGFAAGGSGADYGTWVQTVTDAGNHVVAAWFDYDDHLGQNDEDTAFTGGLLAPEQSWEVDDPEMDIMHHALSAALLNTYIHDGITDNVSFAMGWEFTLGVDDIAIITYTLSAAAPGGFYIQHLNGAIGATTGDDVFLSSTLSKWHYTGTVFDNDLFTPIDTAPIPEPATIALLGIGLVGLAGAEVRRRRKKKAVKNS